MSPQAIASPEELERFARDLKQFNAQLADSMSRLQGQFANLGETWRDQEHSNSPRNFSRSCACSNGTCVFLYPADWKTRTIAENGRREVFITGPRNRAGTYSTSLAVAVTRSAASSPAEAAAELLARYRAAFDSQGTGPSATTVAGLPAVEVEVVYAMPLPPNSIRPQWTEIRQRTVFFKRGGQLYELHYAAPAEDYPTWLPAFRALVQSFAFETETVRPTLRQPIAIPVFPHVREDAPEYHADGSSPDGQPE